MTRAHGNYRIGTSGYVYKHWRGDFYPKILRQKDWFEHYAGHFDSVEINNSFYRLPPPEIFAQWRERAPKGFLYAIKYSRFGTHMKRLLDPEQHMARFLMSALELRRALGPVLVQLPPNWGADAERLNRFLAVAPKKLRWAIEFRDASWLCKPVYEVLERHNAALVIHDLLPKHPEVRTADWCYRRYHGQNYDGCYTPQYLAAHARRIAEDLDAGRDVYAYFNNDLGGHAVRNALDLRRYLDARVSTENGPRQMASIHRGQ